MTYKVLTANRLADGLVVYLCSEGWTDRVVEARKAHDDDAIAALENAGRTAVGRNEVADAWLIDVDDGGIVRWRERIRAAGPTVRPDLGTQARRSA